MTNVFSVHRVVPTPESAQGLSIHDYEEFVKQTVRGMNTIYVSPVFTDENGNSVAITPDMLIQFVPGTDEPTIQTTLSGTESDPNPNLFAATYADDPANPDLTTVPGSDIPGVLVSITEAGLSANPRFFVQRSSSRDGFKVLDTANGLAMLSTTEMAEPNCVYTNAVAVTSNPGEPASPGGNGGGGGGNAPTPVVTIQAGVYPPNNNYASGALWYLNDPDNSPNLFDVNATTAWGYTQGPRNLVHVNALATDSKGNLYYVDGYNIVKFNRSGTYLQTIPVSDAGLGTATSLAIDSNDNLYAGNYSTVTKFSSAGVKLLQFHCSGNAGADDSMGVDGAGNIYTSTQNGGWIGRYSPSGTLTAQGLSALGISVDAAGNVYSAPGPIEVFDVAGG